MFNNNAILLKSRILPSNQCPRNIQNLFVLNLTLHFLLLLRSSSIIPLPRRRDMNTLNIPRPVKPMRFERPRFREDLLVHVQCTRWCNEDGALADKVLIVDDGEGGVFGYAADGEGCCLETEGFAEEGVEEGIGEEGVEVEGGGSGIVWVCGVFVYGGENLIAGGGGEDVEHVPHCSGEGICLS